jgi:hypothetical protein
VASCRQVKNLFTVYLDGEAGGADRVILEQHVQECAECHAALESSRSTAALLFETLSADRLRKDLTCQVMAHLPEMDLPQMENQALTQRAKHPESQGAFGRMRAWVPVFAPMLVVVLGLVLWASWSGNEPATERRAGMVLLQQGPVTSSTDARPQRRNVHLSDRISAPVRYETGHDGGLIMGLEGNSEIRVFEDTRVKVYGAREFRLESGSVHCSVGKGGRYFRVSTPDGLITVFGTVFGVEVLEDSTRVTVVKGEVQVENENTFTVLRDGEQTRLTPETKVLAAIKANVDELVARAAALRPNAAAVTAFHAMPQGPTQKRLRAEQVFVVETKREPVSAIHLEWKPDPFVTGHAGYDVYVSDNNMRPLFKAHVEPQVFSEKDSGRCTIAVPDPKLLSDNSVLHISVLPDYTTGSIETSFTEVALTSP